MYMQYLYNNMCIYVYKYVYDTHTYIYHLFESQNLQIAKGLTFRRLGAIMHKLLPSK